MLKLVTACPEFGSSKYIDISYAAPTEVFVSKSKLTGVTEFSERPVKTTIVFLPTISVESAADTVNVMDCSSPGDNVLLVQL